MRFKELERKAELLGLPIARVVRNYFQRKYLELLESEKAVLQGGAALRFFYGSERLSDDLDFVYQDNVAVEDACKTADRLGVKWSLKRMERLSRLRLYFPFKGAELRLNVELYKVPARKHQKLPLPHTTSEVYVEKPEEIKADKLVALLDNFKRRELITITDLYDLNYIHTNLTQELDIELIKKKFADYEVSFNKSELKLFKSRLEEEAYKLKPVLESYLPKGKPIDENLILSTNLKLLEQMEELL